MILILGKREVRSKKWFYSVPRVKKINKNFLRGKKLKQKSGQNKEKFVQQIHKELNDFCLSRKFLLPIFLLEIS